MNKKRRGQVWIETVTYTLIAFVLIGLILAYAKPKIEELQDQTVLENSIKLMSQIDLVIQEISEAGAGNKRKVEFTLKKGELLIDSEIDTLVFTLKDGHYMFSQPGLAYNESGMTVLTEQRGKLYDITISKNYTNFDIEYDGVEYPRRIQKSSVPYKLYITNKGGEQKLIDFYID